MIKRNESIATRDVNERFEKVSMDIFHYLEIGLIKPFDLTLYLKYLQLYNEDVGYAYPSIYKLEVYLNCSRHSIIEANKRLKNAGLLVSGKYKSNNNIYVPVKPHTREELAKQVPDLFTKFENRRKKIESNASKDKARFEDFLESPLPMWLTK